MKPSSHKTDWLDHVRGPESHARLQPAAPPLIEVVNSAIAAEQLHDASGSLIQQPIDSGLVDSEQACLFPIRAGITILVRDQAIPLDDLDWKPHLDWKTS